MPHIDWLELLSLLARPVATVLIWYIVDKLLKKLHERSNFIDKIFTRQSKSAVRRHTLEQRVKTFRELFIQMVRILNAIFFVFVFLDNLRIDIKPLLAGIGVVGLGLSLAAQNILRDFLNGVFILIEDQFNIGDVVDIGGFSGTVESFTMRATRLRSSDGRLIIIPNGSISQVVNNTKNYSVSVVDVGVAYDTDIPHAMAALRRCGERLREQNPDVIIDNSSVLGIMDFRDNDILLRVNTKTLPGEQWGVGRALRMIIKEEFEKEKIEIPFAQRVIHWSSGKDTDKVFSAEEAQNGAKNPEK